MSNNITITFPDNSERQYDKGITAQEIAESIGPRLAQDVVVCKIDGELRDLSYPIQSNASLELFTGDTEEGHEVLLHSTAHLMAQAVKQIYPNAQVTIGPALENRFYYDFDVNEPFTDEDLLKIENKMKDLAANNQTVTRKEISREKAIDLFEKMNESYKVEIIEGIDSDNSLSLYEQNDFVDLCRGPHVPNTGKIKYFKLLNSSGAYWRGDEKNKMLQRIYGTVFSSKKALNKYLQFLEEAKKRDHRKIGRELDIYIFDDEVGPGLPLWLPNGTVIIDELEALAKETEQRAGYQRVKTPHLTKGDLYKRSGHLTLYKESMYPAMDVDGTDYYVKPMNCPHHHKIYASSPRSYRDLPLRLTEYGTCYRYEKSGQLFGLMRVRSMQMNDAHIYCSEEDFKKEFLAVCDMYLEYFKIFGIEKYMMRFSLHDPAGLGKKYIDDSDMWIKTEQAVREALQDGGLNFTEIPGEAAFYGPKIDVQVWSAIGKEFTLATNQVDFAVPARFNLTYTDADGSDKTPLCIHRAPLGTHERFIGFLIEHFAGDFPVWLAPKQAIVLPISEHANSYGESLVERMISAGIRCEMDDKPDKIGAKIRQSELKKIPVMIIVGEKESESNTVSIRRRLVGDLGTMEFEQFLSELVHEIKTRRQPYRKTE